MKRISSVLLLLGLFALFLIQPAFAPTVEEIERLPFDEAYQLWVQEQAVWRLLSSQPTIVTDLTTGKVTPTTFWALTCRLGRDAHAHEPFLVAALATNECVSKIFETSPALCKKYGVESQAEVAFNPERGYSAPMRGWVSGPDERRKVWLNAINKSTAQPQGAANPSQPVPSETNQTSSAAGSGR
jgi:hypothetical protein